MSSLLVREVGVGGGVGGVVVGVVVRGGVGAMGADGFPGRSVGVGGGAVNVIGAVTGGGI